MTPAARHRRAILFMLVAAVCWSSGGILVRVLSIANAWEIVFWRSLFMALFVAGVLVVMHGRRMPQAVRAVGRPGVVSGRFLAGTFFFFIGSLTRTTVANTFVLMSVSPFLAAIAGRLVLKEAVPARTWFAMGAAFAGIVVMFADSLDAGRLAGNLLALGVSCCFAGQVTVLRLYHAKVDMLPQVMIAGVASLVVAFALAPPFAATAKDLAFLAVMGCVQLGTGCLLATAASRDLSATELGLFALLEPILGPLWVWTLMGEAPGRAALTGGAIVLAAVIGNEIFAAWRTRSGGAGAAAPGPLPPGP
jgi:drug/metabolite transporter (DMT)-like permease